MLFGKKYYDKEVECHSCHKIVRPILKTNILKDGFVGQRFTGLEKKYLLICPYCKQIIGAKN
ncbi:hypothetical protein AYK21_02980 [Thermoplasmatales archaeon SG8-52-2]|nr:MAG: hypothetical protein AYK21_02980 [Thermoplasmatales archaeon SG8-52-2]